MWTLAHLQWDGIRAVVHTSLYVRTSPWMSPATQPDRIKNYPCRPHLYGCRIFIPKGFQENGEKKTLPLVIRAHGGGFLLNYPAVDDILARHLADNANCIVVSLDYSKAPQNKFPAGYEDIVAQSLAAIEDPELPIDPSKVILCGSSAGGNLLLGAAQDTRLRSKLLGVAAIYPVVDMESDCATKMATRPDPTIPDFIGERWASLLDLYIDETQKPSLDDVRLSPVRFATRESLPSEILIIGAEHDMCCAEVEAMADKLAGDQQKATTKEGWKAPGVQFYKAHDQLHAFDGFPIKDPEKEKARVAAKEAMFESITAWLKETFAKASGS